MEAAFAALSGLDSWCPRVFLTSTSSFIKHWCSTAHSREKREHTHMKLCIRAGLHLLHRIVLYVEMISVRNRAKERLVAKLLKL